MAGELTLNVKAVYARSGSEETFPDTAHQSIAVTVTGTLLARHRQSIAVVETALNLAGVTAGGYFVAVNRDAANYVSIRQGTGTTNLIRLKAGEVCAFRLDAASAAPYAIANTAAVELEYLLLSD